MSKKPKPIGNGNEGIHASANIRSQDLVKKEAISSEDVDNKDNKLPNTASRTVERRKIESSLYIGPIPSPEIIKEYEILLPGAANRILSMAEQQQKHRIEMEKQDISTASKLALGNLLLNKRAQIYAFTIIFASLLISAGLLYIDRPVAAITTGIIPVGALIKFLFFFNNNNREVEDEEEIEEDDATEVDKNQLKNKKQPS